MHSRKSGWGGNRSIIFINQHAKVFLLCTKIRERVEKLGLLRKDYLITFLEGGKTRYIDGINKWNRLCSPLAGCSLMSLGGRANFLKLGHKFTVASDYFSVGNEVIKETLRVLGNDAGGIVVQLRKWSKCF